MSETEQETPQPEPDETTPEPEPEPEPEPDEDADEDETLQPEPEPEPQGLTEKEVEARFEKIANESRRHANRIGEILAEDAQDLHECPLCAHFIPGFVYPQPAPEEIVAKVRPYIGLPDLSKVRQAKHAAVCQDCDGLGVVQSGSLVRENAVIGCPTCNRAGYVIVSTGQGPQPVEAPVSTNGEPAKFEGVNHDDPAVAELEKRGFTIIPPIQLPTA